MPNPAATSEPYWTVTATLPRYPALSEPVDTDVVVVGGGITGLTVAYLLAVAGREVVVLERDRCAMADTGHTSAHLTMVTDTRLSELASALGRPHAQAVWDAGLAAIARIEDIIALERIPAGFERVAGFQHLPRGRTSSKDADRVREDATLARELGFDVEYVDSVPLIGTAGFRVEQQARLHPRAYLAGLARAVVEAGGRIFEHSAADEFPTEPRGVRANGHLVRCQQVVLATHNPLVGWAGTAGAALFQTKLSLYTSYVLAARVDSGVVPDALWWDTADPYRYLRLEPRDGHDLVIFGGQDHKTGQTDDTEQCFARLEQELLEIVPTAAVEYRWSGQVIETADGVPYIGSNAEGQYLATGFSGNGLTFGTVAAMMTSDAILGRPNPWTELFDPGRKVLSRGLWDYVKENADYPYYMVRDRFAGADSRGVRAVARGEGAIVEHHGQRVAAYRDRSGALTLKGAACPHMGCDVAWNTAESSWDCPCHGSRFHPDGRVIAGAAESPLSDVE